MTFLLALIIALGLLAFAGLLITVNVLLNGWVLSLLWAWLIVPTFPGLPPLTVAQAIGVSLVATCLTQRYHHQEEKDGKKAATRAAGHLILSPFVYLILGYVVSLFI